MYFEKAICPLKMQKTLNILTGQRYTGIHRKSFEGVKSSTAQFVLSFCVFGVFYGKNS
jgi:hypothetical protein